MRTTKKINPTEYRLPINIKPDLLLTATNYNYLLNFHYYLYQLSFYFFRKYGIYFHPYKFLLLDTKEIIYLYFILFKKFRKKIYRSKKKSQRRWLKKKIKNNLVLKLTKTTNFLTIFKKNFFKKQQRKKKTSYVSLKKYKSLQFYLFFYLKANRTEVVKIKNKKIHLSGFRDSYPSFFFYTRFIFPNTGLKTPLNFGLKKRKKIYRRKNLKIKSKNKWAYFLKRKKIFFLGARLFNLLSALQLKKKMKQLHKIFSKQQRKLRIARKNRKLNSKKNKKRNFLSSYKTGANSSVGNKFKINNIKTPVFNGPKIKKSLKLKILSVVGKWLNLRTFIKASNFTNLLQLLRAKKVKGVYAPKMEKKNKMRLLNCKLDLGLYNKTVLNIISPQLSVSDNIAVSQNGVAKLSSTKKFNNYSSVYSFFLKNFHRRSLFSQIKRRKFYFQYWKKKKWLRRRIYKIFLKTRKKKRKQQKFKIRLLNSLSKRDLNRKKTLLKILLRKIVQLKKKLVFGATKRQTLHFTKNIFNYSGVSTQAESIKSNYFYTPAFYQIIRVAPRIKKILKKNSRPILTAQELFRRKETFVTQNKLEVLNWPLNSQKKYSTIISLKLKLKFQYLFKLLSRKFFPNKQLDFFLTPLTSFIRLNKNVQKEFLILYKRLRFVKTKRKYYSRLFIFHFLSLYYKNFFLLLPYYKYFLMRKKKQKKFLYKIINLYRAIYYYKQHQILGIQFLMHGTFDRHGRTRKFLYIIGKFKISSLSLPILFDWIDFSSKYGTISLKIWIIYRNFHKKIL